MNQPRTARDRLDRVFAIGRRMGRFSAAGLGVAILVGGGAAAYANFLHKRVYKSEAVLRYRDAARAAELGGEDPEERGPRLVARLRDSGLSRARLEQIITDIRIYGDTIADRSMADAVDEMRGHIGFRALDGETFAVSFDGTKPQRVRDVTARLADALVLDSAGKGAPVAAAAAAPAHDNGDRERIEKELKDREHALTAFIVKHPEFTRESAPNAPPPRPRVVQPPRNDTTLATLERETARLQERLAQPAAHPIAKEDIQAETALVAAKSAADNELAAAQKDLADKLAKFTDEHPDVRAARERVKAAQDKVKHADDALNASLAAAQQKAAAQQEDEGYIDRGALENQLKRINDEIAEYKRRKENAAPTTQVASSVVAQEAEWMRLRGDIADAEERLAAARTAESKAPAATAADNVAAIAATAPLVVVDPAFVPGREEWPGRTQITVAGALAGVVLGFLFALLLALLDERVYDRVDIERMGLPLLSVMPREGVVKLG
ncbi:MAG TPA: hypothetical protein VGL86_08580 [Polyangia bacterium]